MYEIIYSKTAFKQIQKLDKINKARIVNTINRIRIRPHAHVKKLVGYPNYSLRVGAYRVILDIVDDKLIIFNIEVGYRRNIYS